MQNMHRSEIFYSSASARGPQARTGSEGLFGSTPPRSKTGASPVLAAVCCSRPPAAQLPLTSPLPTARCCVGACCGAPAWPPGGPAAGTMPFRRPGPAGEGAAEGPGGSASDSGAAAFAAPDGVLEGAAGGAGAGAAAAGGERAASDWRSPASQSSHMSPCLSTRLIHWCMPCAGLPAPTSHLRYGRCSGNSQQMTPWRLGHGTTVHLPAGCFHRHAEKGAPPWQAEQPKGGKTVGWAGTPAMVPTTLAGEPATIVRGATSFSTSDPAATCAAGHPALWFADRNTH